jgi:hypothetical protein
MVNVRVLICSIVLLTSAFPVAADAPDQLTSKDAEAAIAKLVASIPGAKKTAIKVHQVHGCYPIEAAPTDYACAIEHSAGGSPKVQEIPFRWERGARRALNPDTRTIIRCPAETDAQKLLSGALLDTEVRVTDMPDSGLITDDRGMMRDGKGPHRLMCTYGIEGTLGPKTVVGYFRFENGAYKLDPHPEIWSD